MRDPGGPETHLTHAGDGKGHTQQGAAEEPLASQPSQFLPLTPPGVSLWTLETEVHSARREQTRTFSLLILIYKLNLSYFSLKIKIK